MLIPRGRSGNGGTSSGNAKVSNVKLSGFDEITSFCREQSIDLVVVGPEQPLVDGISDHLAKQGIPCFGPSARASQLEGSKAFSKAFMARHEIPTAAYAVFDDLSQALAYVQSAPFRIVIKASGLAAGKGVILPTSVAEAEAALRDIMEKKIFGAAGSEVVIEEFLEGEEVSVLAFCDGYTVVPLPAAQDHKRIFDGDAGPNTGGMGAYAPAPLATPALLAQVQSRVLEPTVAGLRRDGMPYVGVLYAGIMVTAAGPKVLEFNCRLGDPETQVVLPLLADDCDLAQIMLACVDRRLDSVKVAFKDMHAVTVVVAAKGYPGDYAKGTPIAIESGSVPRNATVFHAGTAAGESGLVTSGGRVLAVTAVAATLKEAVDDAYKGVAAVTIEGAQFRKDIAHRALRPAAVRGVTYADSGVDVDRGDHFVDLIKPLAKMTARPGSNTELGGTIWDEVGKEVGKE